MTDTVGYNIYDTQIDGRHRYFLSLLPYDIGFDSGLPSEAILGEFIHGPESRTPEAFLQNPQFLNFLSYAIGKHASSCPGLIAESQRLQNGFVYILDKRTPTPDDGVPPEDIIGAAEVQNGKILQFLGSPNNCVLTGFGFMQLDPWLKERLVEELIAVATRDRNIDSQ